jgi:hypothetical protein
MTRVANSRREHLLSFVAEAAIPAADRVAGYRLVSDMRAAMRASYDWCGAGNRYSADSITSLGPSGCLSDIISPQGAAYGVRKMP